MISFFCDDEIILEHWMQSLSGYSIKTVSAQNTLFENDIVMTLGDLFTANQDIFIDFINKGVKLFVLDTAPSFETAKKVLSLNAYGYANAMMHKIHLCSAVQTIIDGQIWLYPDFVNKLISDFSKTPDVNPENSRYLARLTAREKELAILSAKGMTQYEIADKLEISIRTVKAHTSSIYEKLGVKDRLSLSLLLRSSTKVQ